jgi:hypothetical protein
MTKLPDLPEVELADDAMIYQRSRRVEYGDIEAIIFEVLPLLQNRIARAFYGIDVQVPFGSSSYTPKLALHLSDGEIIWVSRGWDFVVSSARAEAVCTAATLVGYNTLNAAGERLLTNEIFNAVLVLLVVTSLLGPVLTELFTPGMIRQEARTKTVAA